MALRIVNIELDKEKSYMKQREKYKFKYTIEPEDVDNIKGTMTGYVKLDEFNLEKALRIAKDRVTLQMDKEEIRDDR